MFRCDWCENYRDKSECCENPKDSCGNICEECEDEYEERKRRGCWTPLRADCDCPGCGGYND